MKHWSRDLFVQVAYSSVSDARPEKLRNAFGYRSHESILPKTLYDKQFNQWPLRSTKVKLKVYNGVQIPVN